MRYIKMSDVNTIKLQNDVQTAGTVAVNTSASNKTSAPIEIVDKNVVEGQGNTDVAVTNNSSNTSNTAKRSVDELYNSIAALCTQYGISLAEAKKIGLLERIAGVQQQELLNYPNSEIQKQVECLKAALEKLSKKGDKIDLEEVVKLANNYSIAIKTGWTIKGFEKANASNSENINQRLIRFLGLPKDFDFSKLSKEEQVEITDRYFNQYFQMMIAKGKSPEEVAKLQLQDFGKLLINTPDDQKELFKVAFASVVSKNRNSALHALLESFKTQEARTECADSITVDDLERAARPDINGEVPPADDMTDMAATTAKEQSEEGLTESTEKLMNRVREFFEQNQDALERIAEKIRNNEELTDEEQAIKDKLEGFINAILAGHIAGSANNQIISDDFKENLLGQINRETYELPNYRDVMSKVSEYVEKHPEACTLPSKDFDKLMDKVTNGNYSTVVNDAKNGTTTALNAPTAPVEVDTTSSVATTSSASSFANNSQVTSEVVAESRNRVQVLTAQIQQNSKPENTAVASSKKDDAVLPQTKNIKTFLEKGVEGFKEYVKSNGTINAVVDIFNNMDLASQGVINKATQFYAIFTGSRQVSVLKKVDNSGLSELLPHTKESTLSTMKNETFSNFYATKMVQEAAEEVEEKNQIA